ncbi:LacI family transcriptional regulator [Eubacteriales bacterium OttesenSCG-928-A19]|nr:LacI family transcriptional regulator [Eubacteriales bacterium OttesenSCG-928-A19]
MAVLLKDIAKATGFSTTTVSLALNHSPRISESTKKIVFEAAQKLNYVPNRVARSLATRQSQMIGLIVRAFDSTVLSKVAALLETALADKGYGLLLVTTSSPRNEMDVLRMLESHQVDGIFMFPTLPPDKRLIDYVRGSMTPVIFLSYGQYETCTDAVYYDREHSTYLLTKHLLDLGHREIGLICGSGQREIISLDAERLHGYIRALEERGIPFNTNNTAIPMGKNEYEDGYDAARELTRRCDLTAIVASTDGIAIGVIHYFRTHGVRVPEDISVVSHDGSEVAQFAAVPITSTYYDVRELVDHAVPLMMERLANPEEKSPEQVIALKSRLDIRASTAPCAK